VEHFFTQPHVPSTYATAQPEQTGARLLPRLVKLFKEEHLCLRFAETCLALLVCERGPHANEADLLSVIRWDYGGNEGIDVACREVRLLLFVMMTHMPITCTRTYVWAHDLTPNPQTTHTQQVLLKLKPEPILSVIEKNDEDKYGVPKAAFSSDVLDRISKATVRAAALGIE
jgi:hypothetical protein